jgi:hypothetical protein
MGLMLIIISHRTALKKSISSKWSVSPEQFLRPVGNWQTDPLARALISLCRQNWPEIDWLKQSVMNERLKLLVNRFH